MGLKNTFYLTQNPFKPITMGGNILQETLHFD